MGTHRMGARRRPVPPPRAHRGGSSALPPVVRTRRALPGSPVSMTRSRRPRQRLQAAFRTARTTRSWTTTWTTTPTNRCRRVSSLIYITAGQSVFRRLAPSRNTADISLSVLRSNRLSYSPNWYFVPVRVPLACDSGARPSTGHVERGDDGATQGVRNMAPQSVRRSRPWHRHADPGEPDVPGNGDRGP